MTIDIKERLHNVVSKISLRRRSKPSKKTEDNTRGGIIYTIWLFILPLISGVVLGYLVDVGLSYILDSISDNAGMRDVSVSGVQSSSETGKSKRTLDEFMAKNPFHISPMKPEVAEAPKPQEEPKPREQDKTLDNVILRGTLPGIGAWFENEGKLELTLVNKNIGRYKLASVNYSEAVFRRGRERITKYITYGPVVDKPQEEKPAQPARPREVASKPADDQIVAAAPGSTEGQISSEMVNQLIQNPFDELKRIRMRPNEKNGGLEVQWIQSDSILKRLGVQKGDVIKSVNGIPFTNMGDIANSISSLMNSERFDVEVTRGGKSEALRYVVK